VGDTELGKGLGGASTCEGCCSFGGCCSLLCRDRLLPPAAESNPSACSQVHKWFPSTTEKRCKRNKVMCCVNRYGLSLALNSSHGSGQDTCIFLTVGFA